LDLSGNLYAGCANRSSNSCIVKWDNNENVGGIPPYATIGNFTVYPNPTQNKVNLKVIESGQATLYNQFGEPVYTQNFDNGNASMQLEKLASGVYTLIFRGQNSIYAPVKVVKE